MFNLFLVQKFRKRPVYMEYLAQVLIKSLIDSAHDDFLSWYDENQTFISKRNELLLGPWRMIITRGEGVIAIAGSNENKYGNKKNAKLFNALSLILFGFSCCINGI